MSTYPYLRAYMAGIALPTLVMLLVGSVFTLVLPTQFSEFPREIVGHRYIYHLPYPIERAIIFPLAFIPNLFGLWNMLYIKLHPGSRWPIGLHGAVLPFFIAPLGFAYGSALGIVQATATGFLYFDSFTIPYSTILAVAPLPLVVYYLVWKYIIAFFNRVLALA